MHAPLSTAPHTRPARVALLFPLVVSALLAPLAAEASSARVRCDEYRAGEMGVASAALKATVKEVMEDRRYLGDDEGPAWEALREAHRVLRGNNHGGKRLIKAVAALQAVLPSEMALSLSVEQIFENLEASAGDRIEEIGEALEDLPDVRATRKAKSQRRKARKALREHEDLPAGVQTKPARRMKSIVGALDNLVAACRLVSKAKRESVPDDFPRTLEAGTYKLFWSMSTDGYAVEKTHLGQARLDNLREFADQVLGVFETIESGFVGRASECAFDTRYEVANSRGFNLRQTITCPTKKGARQVWSFRFMARRIEG